jgi:uncharacterized protein YwgA
MERLQRSAVMLSLIEKLKANGSWCGETHIQKATYFLKELLGVPLNYEFTLYKHGPYSFDLTDEITAMRADSLLKLQPMYPYGPSYTLGESSALIKERFPKTTIKYQEQIEFVAQKLGPNNVASLERLATALYVTLNEEMCEMDDRADCITDIKPHIPIEDAREAVTTVDRIIEEARQLH